MCVLCLVPPLAYSFGLIHSHLGDGYPDIVFVSGFAFDILLPTLISFVPPWLSGVFFCFTSTLLVIFSYLSLEVSLVTDAF